MISIGKVNKLTVCRETSSGHYLRDFASDEEVFLPPALSHVDIKMDEEIEVFFYVDAKDMLICTTKIPVAQVGDFALLRAINVQEFGAFFEWGIDKDLLVPGNEQKFKVREGEYHTVKICLEEGTDRLYGTTKLGKYIEASKFDFNVGDMVEAVPTQETDLGYKVIINQKFIGMIYHNEIFQDIEIEKSYKAIVKKIREDGLVDCSLQKHGIDKLLDAKRKVLKHLEQKGGRSDLSDKSTPLQIKDAVNMSKQTFKSAIGMLYKERRIAIKKTGIELVTKK